MQDAVGLLSPEARRAYDQGDLADLAFADDTLLLGVSAAHLENFLQAVASAGERFGMELHNGKLQLICIRCDEPVTKPGGEPLQPQQQMQYLGTMLSEDGRVSSELGRRIGQAKSEFRSLCKVWGHSSLSLKRKLRVFDSLVQSKFLYGLATCCFTVAEQRRINGFQAKCLRQILGIAPSFLSRVSNAEVLRRSHMSSALELLAQQQLTQLGKVLRAPQDSALHHTSLIPGTLQPATSRYVRRRGRPHKEWIPTVLSEAFRRKQPNEQLYDLAQDSRAWKGFVRR